METNRHFQTRVTTFDHIIQYKCEAEGSKYEITHRNTGTPFWGHALRVVRWRVTVGGLRGGEHLAPTFLKLLHHTTAGLLLNRRVGEPLEMSAISINSRR